MAASTVTERTSVVLVSSIGTKVYLSSVGYPGHIVTIKDFAGVASQGNPIVVSTTKDVFFADGSISTLLFNPFSFLTVSSKTPTTWQILNNLGFLTTLSNSFLETLTSENAYLTIMSTVTDVVSTSVANTVNVTKSINIFGNVDILGNITVNGEVDFFSTVNVKEDISFSTGFTVNGPVAIASSLFVRDAVTVQGDVFTTGDIVVGGDMYISSILRVSQALVPKNLSVQTLSMNELNVFGNLQGSESLSTQSLFVGDSLTTLSSFLTSNNLILSGHTTIGGDTQIQNELITSVLEVQSSGVIQKEASVSSLIVNGTFSTAGNLFVSGLLNAMMQTNTTHALVTGDVSTQSFTLSGNAEISTILTSSLQVLGDVHLFQNLTTGFLSAANTQVLGDAQTLNARVGGITSTTQNFTILGDVFVQSSVVVKENAFFETLSSLSTIVVGQGVSTNTLFVGTSLIVDGNFSIPGTATVGALAAPIAITLSTLTLSNTLEITTRASIPILFTGESNPTGTNTIFPGEMRIGTTNQAFGGFLKTPSMNVRELFQDLNQSTNVKNIIQTRVSTLEDSDYLKLFLVGTSNFSQPFGPTPGRFILGCNQSFAATFDITNYFEQISLRFSTIAFGAAYGKDTWVSVGQDGLAVSSIKYSKDTGFSWREVNIGGFPVQSRVSPAAIRNATGKDVIYMSTTYQNGDTEGHWIAGGIDSTVGFANVSLQQSSNGLNWVQIFQPPPAAFTEVNRLFVHSFPDPFLGTIALAGGNKGFGNFGISFSHDLNNWSNCTTVHPGAINFTCEDVCEDNNKALFAVGYVGANRLFQTFGAADYSNGWNSNVSSNLPMALQELRTIAFGNGRFVIGGTPAFGQASNSLWYTPTSNLGLWQRVTRIGNAGFTVRANKIIYDNTLSTFIAVGSNTGGSNLQFSQNGDVWSSYLGTFSNELFNITPSNARILAPDFVSQYFVTNTSTRFQSGISTAILNLSSVRASSIQANSYSGDVSLLSNISNFGSSIFASSISVRELLYNDTEDLGFFLFIRGSTIASTAVINYANSGPDTTTSELSNVYAAGEDTVDRGTVQLTSNNSNWQRATNAVFNGYGNAIYGNSNFLVDPDANNNTSNSASGIVAPVLVATGADTRTNHTIQYSRDGFAWFPVEAGGFSIPNNEGFKVGNTVAYRSFPYRFLVGGEAPGTMSTIFYSDDGFSFQPVNPSPFIMNSVKKIKYSFGPNAIGINDSNYIIHSSDGITWHQTSTNVQFSAFAFASNAFFGIWAFATNNAIYRSSDFGSNFEFYTDGTSDNPFIRSFPEGNIIDFVNVSLHDTFALITSPPSMPAVWVPDFSFNPPLSVWFYYQFTSNYKSIFYDALQDIAFVGSESEIPDTTIWYVPGSNVGSFAWTPISPPDGFSSFTEGFGEGFGIASYSTLVVAGGLGTFFAGQPPEPQILKVNPANSNFFPFLDVTTTTLLTQSNSSNVFKTNVRAVGIASTNQQAFPYLALGDGDIPQKTIARSSNLTEWLPAITGGFSTGYGVTYYNNSDGTSIWLAVGAATNSNANIQYSSDGANWFATNNSGGIQSGGRGIALLSTATINRLVVVGESPFNPSPDATIVYSDNGFDWFKGNGNVFFEAGYCIAAGNKTGNSYAPAGDCLIAGGKREEEFNTTLKVSSDGITWQVIGQDLVAARINGVAYGNKSGFPDVPVWVAVGEPLISEDGAIWFSDDGDNWNQVNPKFPFVVGYAVTFSQDLQYFIAVGKSDISLQTILISFDGQAWYPLVDGGFNNTRILGSANGLYTQSNTVLEQNPFVEFSNFVAYSRELPRPYSIPSLRTFSTTIVLNEAMYVNTSTVTINTIDVVQNSALTVDGNIETSTLIYKGTELPGTADIYTLTVSSLQVGTNIRTNIFETPSWGYETTNKANVLGVDEFISQTILGPPYYYFKINETLSVSASNRPLVNGTVGINIADPKTTITGTPSQPYLAVDGTVACSSLTTGVFRLDNTLSMTIPDSTYIQSSNLTITSIGPNVNSNTIYSYYDGSDVAYLQFNNRLIIQQSTQRVGCYTLNPEFDFDVRSKGYFSTLTTQTINTNMLNLRAQYF